MMNWLKKSKITEEMIHHKSNNSHKKDMGRQQLKLKIANLQNTQRKNLQNHSEGRQHFKQMG